MALYSGRVYLDHADSWNTHGTGIISTSSYLQVDIDSVDHISNEANVTARLYGALTQNRLYDYDDKYGIYNPLSGTVSGTTRMTTSMRQIAVKTGTLSLSESGVSINCNAEIQTVNSVAYGIAAYANVCVRNEAVQFAFPHCTGYPSQMKFGVAGSFAFSDSATYKLDFATSSGNVCHTQTVSGKSASVTVPTRAFAAAGGASITKCYVTAHKGATPVYRAVKPVTITDDRCSATISAMRTPTSGNDRLVTCKVSGISAAVSTSRTVEIQVRETNTQAWVTKATLNPATRKFENAEATFDLATDAAYNVRARISDGYTTAYSSIVRIFATAYLMDFRTDGRGAAFGAAAANVDELYCMWDLHLEGSFRMGSTTLTESELAALKRLLD